MYKPHILPKIQREKWGVAYIQNNFTLHFKKNYIHNS
jgi:transcriptional antiterminator